MMDEALKVKAASEMQAHKEIRGHARDYGNFLVQPGHLLELSYDELEEKNLAMKAERLAGKTSEDVEDKVINYLTEEKGIKAVVVCFCDLEGRLHLLDYDKKHIVGSYDNLTFDGSSIKGFTPQDESDLRLKVDWTTLRWLPSDIFGAGKVMVFSNVCNEDGSFYAGDFRGQLTQLTRELLNKEGMMVNVAPEVEGFLFKGEKAEQDFDELEGFELATMSGYFNCLPQDTLRVFMDKFAEVQRALGFQNEKDHPEVAPAQFELNFRYSAILDTADQILLYKLIARQVAKAMGLTASFLPKPVQGMNGSGMHTNISISKDDTNLFYDGSGENNLSETARKFITGVLAYANDLCLVMNSSVNAYRRLDPHFEAPNEIKYSSIDRGSMVRIPIGNAKSARIEVRTVAPDANPYLCFYAILNAGLAGMNASDEQLKTWEEKLYKRDVEKLPGDIYGAIEKFGESDFMKNIMGGDNHEKYLDLKQSVADRSPRSLGTSVKTGEVIYHHEVTNQLLWSHF